MAGEVQQVVGKAKGEAARPRESEGARAREGECRLDQTRAEVHSFSNLLAIFFLVRRLMMGLPLILCLLLLLFFLPHFLFLFLPPPSPFPLPSPPSPFPLSSPPSLFPLFFCFLFILLLTPFSSPLFRSSAPSPACSTPQAFLYYLPQRTPAPPLSLSARPPFLSLATAPLMPRERRPSGKQNTIAAQWTQRPGIDTIIT